jgi:rubredoxin
MTGRLCICWYGTHPVSQSPTATQQWICQSCGSIYDPEMGDLDGGIPAGTAFEDIPGDWVCPVCGARKSEFIPLTP